ncbi:dTMP kinase [Nakamurella sp.]|uniref:dTMP kinase n=1 Tax=Nakamurella sp. TaxID=1869182 RepID=UPI0037843F52
MGQLIVIEGLDGSGKRTLAGTLAARWQAQGRTVASLAFPRYGVDVHADLVQDALYGRLGDLSDSVYGPALLFALDRRAAAEEIRDLLAAHDVVLLDRYVASNAAYGSARLGGPDRPTDFAAWVQALEIDRFGVPVPDRQLLLATPVEVAARRARTRAGSEQDRALDRFEADDGLQRRTAAMYRQLAAHNYLSPWTVLTPDADGAISLPAAVG